MSIAPDMRPLGPWWNSLVALLATFILMLSVFFDSVSSMMAVWIGATTYHHCFLVLPISLFLVWQRREALARITPCHEPFALLPLLAFAFLWLTGRAGQIQLLEHVALIGMAISITIALLGFSVARLIAFPLAFLLFMVPFGDFLIPTLQTFTADFAVLLIRMLDIPIFRDGIMIETPSGLFEVAEACAGIRFLIANVMVATLFAHLAMGRVWKWAVFLALAFIVPIIANGFRATGILLIAYWTDHEYAAGVDHLIYGWGFFAVVMLTFLAIGSWMADWPDDAGHKRIGSIEVDVSPWRPAFSLPLVVLILAAPVYATAVIDQVPGTTVIDPKKALSPTLAQSLAPACKTAGIDGESWRPLFKKADFSRSIQLDCAGHSVDLFVAYYAYEREGAELIHYANRLADGDDWKRISASRYKPRIDGLPRTLKQEDLVGRNHEDRLVLAWYWVDGRLMTHDWQVKAYQLYQKLLGRDEPSALVALSAPYSDDPDEALTSVAEILKRHKDISDYLVDLKPEH